MISHTIRQLESRSGAMLKKFLKNIQKKLKFILNFSIKCNRINETGY